jgi:cardiolipin synthase
LRLLLVAPFVVLLQNHQSHPVYRYVATGLFAFMAASDVLDGYLARRLNSRSRLGAILDPLADKTLIICAVVLLSLPHSAVAGATLPGWVVVMIVGKDLWVIGGFLIIFLLTGSVHVLPSGPGKICTAGQVAMVAAVLISPELNLLSMKIGTHLAMILWYTVAGLCAISVISYTRIGLTFVAETDIDNDSDSEDSECVN